MSRDTRLPSDPGSAAAGREPSSAGAPGRRTLTGLIQRRPRGGTEPATTASEPLAAAGGSTGEPLPAALRDKYEGSLGTSLAPVRVHTGAASAEAASAFSARAFTTGTDIHFGAGEYQPGSADGEHLLAHEVAHTVQQGAGGRAMQTKLTVSQPGDALEREADAAATQLVAGHPAAVTGGTGAAIARKEAGVDAASSAAVADAAADAATADGGGAAQPVDGLDKNWFEISGGDPQHAGKLALGTPPKPGEILVEAPWVRAEANIKLKPGIKLRPQERIDVGCIQTLLGSERTAIYKKDGVVVAEQRTALGELRDAQWKNDESGRTVSTHAFPWVSRPNWVSEGSPEAFVKTEDRPAHALPTTLAGGTLAELRGSDRFTTSFGAKRDGAIVHLKAYNWQVPWDMRFDQGAIALDAGGKSTAGEVTSAAAPNGRAVDGPLAVAEGPAATHTLFKTQEGADGASVFDLVKSLPFSLANDPAASGVFVRKALETKKPSFRIKVSVRNPAGVALVSDKVVVRVFAGWKVIVRDMTETPKGGSVEEEFPLTDLFSLHKMSRTDQLTIQAGDQGGIIKHAWNEIAWSWPFHPQDTEIKMRGGEGDYWLSGRLS